jgi:L-alanine-DL-glutamate epimerase-like enolase superfamily enzyme
MHVHSIEVFVFKYNHHYRVGGHSDSPNRIPGTDYYFEPQWRHAYSRLTESCLIKITTEEGITGWGESQAPLVPEVPATLIAKLLGPAIFGIDISDPGIVYDRLLHLNHVRGHANSFTVDAIAGIDTALWDIKGQAAQKPLSRLLNTNGQQQLPLYISGLRRPVPAQRIELAKETIRQGFSGVKIFSGARPEQTIKECQAIRQAIGSHAIFALDAIGSQDYNSAVSIGKELDALQAAWFEAPLDPEKLKDHVKLVASIATPVAIGEQLRTMREFEPWIEQGALKIAQPDIVRCGISGSTKIVEKIAEQKRSLAFHLGVCTAIGMAATWHLASVVPGILPQEHQLDMFATANKILNEPLKVEGGQALVPAGNGLGISVNEEFIRAYSADRWTISNNKVEYSSAGK